MGCYRIRNWKTFENNRSRQIERLTWVPMPNHHDGAAFAELLEHANGAAHYGCWALTVQVASKCDPRGVLVKSNGEPHTPESVARMVRVKPEVMREAFERLVHVGWLEMAGAGERQVDVTPTSGGRQEGGIEGNGREVNGMETPAQTDAQVGLNDAVAGNGNGAMASLSSPTPPVKPGHGREKPPAPSPIPIPVPVKPQPEPYNGSTLWAAWVDLHRARSLNDPASLGPDIGAAGRLARAIPRERLAEVLGEFLDDDDQFLDKRGHALRDLGGRLNSYLNGAGGETVEQAVDRIAAELRTKRMAGEENFNEL